MSIQYSKNKKLTLPSVEEWTSDLGIVKDPPRGYFTRQNWKVSDTQNIVETIDDSGDRIGECINNYARGINPMVGVSYNNSTNNAGTFKNNFSNISGIGQQASSVNKIQNFRPPIFTNIELLPLSRLPRKAVSIEPVFQATDWTKSKYTQNEFRQIKKDIFNIDVKPTAITKLSNGVNISEPFQLKYNVITDDKIKVSAESGILKKANIIQNNRVQTKGVQDNYTEVHARTNISDNTKYIPNINNIDTGKYTQELNNVSVVSNISDKNYIPTLNLNNIDTGKYTQELNNVSVVSNISDKLNNKTSLFELADFNIKVKDNVLSTYDYVTPMKGYEMNSIENYNEQDYDLDRAIPLYSAETNISDNKVYKKIDYINEIELERNTPLTHIETMKIQNDNPNNMNINARIFNRLHDTLTLGEFNGSKTIPKILRQEELNINPDKRKLLKSAGESFRERFADIKTVL